MTQPGSPGDSDRLRHGPPSFDLSDLGEVTPTPIRIGVVSAHPLVRFITRTLCAPHTDLRIAWEATGGTEAALLHGEEPVGVVLLDRYLSDGTSPETLRWSSAAHPPRILMLSGAEDDGWLQRCVRAGALGALGRGWGPEALPEAIRLVAAGRTVGVLGDPRWTRSQVSHAVERRRLSSSLTPRLREVLALLADGHSTREIAATLHLSERTVHGHVARLYRLLDARGRVQLVRRGMAAGLLEAG